MSDKNSATFDQAALDAKLAEQKQAITTELSAKHKTALDEVSARLAEATKIKGELEASLATANKAKDEAVAALASRDKDILATLSAVGVKAEKVDVADIKAKLTSRISNCAQEFLAASGMKPLAEIINDSAELDAKLSTDAGILAKYESMEAGPERIAFLEKHEKAIWRAQTNRK